MRSIIRNYAVKSFKQKFLKSTSSQKQWVMITGATGGIGQEFSGTLAELGFDVIAIGRNEDKLLQLKDKISQYGVESELAIIDLENLNTEQIESKVNEILNKKEVRVLVNCVGLGGRVSDFGEGLSFAEHEKFIRVNLMSHLIFSHCFISHSISHSPDQSLILNISSLLGSKQAPGLSLYSSCKNFQRHFNASLSQEDLISKKRIKIVTVQPWYIDTLMVKRIKAYCKISPQMFVDSTILSCGLGLHKFLPTPNLSHLLIYFLLRFAPSKLFGHFFYQTIKKFKLPTKEEIRKSRRNK